MNLRQVSSSIGDEVELRDGDIVKNEGGEGTGGFDGDGGVLDVDGKRTSSIEMFQNECLSANDVQVGDTKEESRIVCNIAIF